MQSPAMIVRGGCNRSKACTQSESTPELRSPAMWVFGSSKLGRSSDSPISQASHDSRQLGCIGDFHMSRYLIEREFPDGLHIPLDESGAQLCRNVIDNNAEDGVTWLHSYVTPIANAPSVFTTDRRRRRCGVLQCAVNCQLRKSPRFGSSIRTSTNEVCFLHSYKPIPREIIDEHYRPLDINHVVSISSLHRHFRGSPAACHDDERRSITIRRWLTRFTKQRRNSGTSMRPSPPVSCRPRPASAVRISARWECTSYWAPESTPGL